MKRRDLLRAIARTAKNGGVNFDLVREGSSHSVYRCGVVLFTVPRHSEINELTARGIMRNLEAELGEGWWR